MTQTECYQRYATQRFALISENLICIVSSGKDTCEVGQIQLQFETFDTHIIKVYQLSEIFNGSLLFQSTFVACEISC